MDYSDYFNGCVSVSTEGKPDGSLEVKGMNYWMKRPSTVVQKAFMEPFKKEVSSASEEALKKLMDENNVDSQQNLAKICELMGEVMQLNGYNDMIQHELEWIEKVRKAKEYISLNKDTFNKVSATTSGDSRRILITNAIYMLRIDVQKPTYRKYHVIHFSLMLNNSVFFNIGARSNIEFVENATLNDPDKIEKYIQNKLKKYSFLFTNDNILLKNHADRYDIPDRLINELDIRIVETEKELKS